MSKEKSPETRLNEILQEQQVLVHQLKDATPARKLQIQAEIVALSEEQANLLQEAGAVNCFIYTTSSSRGTGWIEEERNWDGSVRQYRYGYYRNGRSNRRYVPKRLVADVQHLIDSKAKPESILEFLDLAKTQAARLSQVQRSQARFVQRQKLKGCNSAKNTGIQTITKICSLRTIFVKLSVFCLTK